MLVSVYGAENVPTNSTPLHSFRISFLSGFCSSKCTGLKTIFSLFKTTFIYLMHEHGCTLITLCVCVRAHMRSTTMR